MSPYAKLEAAYAAHPKEEPLANYVQWHMRHGFVFARPDVFLMGRPVLRSAPPEAVKDPMHLFPSEQCDAWYIHAAAGNMSAMWSLMPWPLGWIGWTRLYDPQSELVFHPVERLIRLCPTSLAG